MPIGSVALQYYSFREPSITTPARGIRQPHLYSGSWSGFSYCGDSGESHRIVSNMFTKLSWCVKFMHAAFAFVTSEHKHCINVLWNALWKCKNKKFRVDRYFVTEVLVYFLQQLTIITIVIRASWLSQSCSKIHSFFTVYISTQNQLTRYLTKNNSVNVIEKHPIIIRL